MTANNGPRTPSAPKLKNGYIYGRGTLSAKSLLAAELAVMVEIKRRNLKLSRDVILVSEADEEAGMTGIQWLIQNAWSKIDAEFALNEGGSLIGNQGRHQDLRDSDGGEDSATHRSNGARHGGEGGGSSTRQSLRTSSRRGLPNFQGRTTDPRESDYAPVSATAFESLRLRLARAVAAEARQSIRRGGRRGANRGQGYRVGCNAAHYHLR